MNLLILAFLLPGIGSVSIPQSSLPTETLIVLSIIGVLLIIGFFALIRILKGGNGG